MHSFTSRFVTPVTLVVAAMMCFLLMIGYFLQSSYQRAIVDAENETRNLVEVIESRLSSEFSRVDGMLTFVAHGVQSDPFHSRSVAVSAEQTQHLALMVKSFPQLAGLFAFDADGTMQISSDPRVKPFSAAGHPHFQTLRDNPNTSLEFSEPLVSRSAGKWSMIQSRSIRDDAGKFLGSVSGVHHIDTYLDLFRSINVGQNGGVLLRRSDNFKLIARIPRLNEKDFNQPIPENNPIRQRIESGDKRGTLAFTASTDGVRRIGSFSRLDDRFPFYVQVAFSEDYYLAVWRRQVLWTGLFVVPLLLAFAVALVRLDSNRKTEVLLQKELSDRGRRLNSIIEGTHVGTWEWNVQSGEAIFNERWAEIIGYTLDELSPISIKTWSMYCHPDDLKHSGELLEKHFAKELAYYECEARMRHKDGHWVVVLDRGKVTSRTADGKPLLMSGTHQDITERRSIENKLAKLLKDQDAILNSDVVGFAIVSQRVMRWVNPAMAKMFGYETHEMCSVSTRIFYQNDDAFDAFGRDAYAEINAGRVYHGQHQWCHKNGCLKWFDISGVRLPSDNEATIWALVDISGLKLMENTACSSGLLIWPAIELGI